MSIAKGITNDNDWSNFNPLTTLTKDRLRRADLAQKIYQAADAFFSDDCEDDDSSMQFDSIIEPPHRQYISESSTNKTTPDSTLNAKRRESLTSRDNGGPKVESELKPKQKNATEARKRQKDLGEKRTRDKEEQKTTPKKPTGFTSTPERQRGSAQSINKSVPQGSPQSEFSERTKSTIQKSLEKQILVELPPIFNRLQSSGCFSDFMFVAEGFNSACDLESGGSKASLALWRVPLSSVDMINMEAGQDLQKLMRLSGASCLWTTTWPYSLLTHVHIIRHQSHYLILAITATLTQHRKIIQTSKNGPATDQLIPSSDRSTTFNITSSSQSYLSIFDINTGVPWIKDIPITGGPICKAILPHHDFVNSTTEPYSFPSCNTVALLSCYGCLHLLNLDPLGVSANNCGDSGISQLDVTERSRLRSLDLSPLCQDRDLIQSSATTHTNVTQLESVRLHEVYLYVPKHCELNNGQQLEAQSGPILIVVMTNGITYGYDEGLFERLDDFEFTHSDFLTTADFEEKNYRSKDTKDFRVLRHIQQQSRSLQNENRFQQVGHKKKTDIGTILLGFLYSSSLGKHLTSYSNTIPHPQVALGSKSSIDHLLHQVGIGSEIGIKDGSIAVKYDILFIITIWQVRCATYLASSLEFIIWLRLTFVRASEISDLTLLQLLIDSFLHVLEQQIFRSFKNSNSLNKEASSDQTTGPVSQDRETWGNYDSILSDNVLEFQNELMLNGGEDQMELEFYHINSHHLSIRWASLETFVKLNLDPKTVFIEIAIKAVFPERLKDILTIDVNQVQHNCEKPVATRFHSLDDLFEYIVQRLKWIDVEKNRRVLRCREKTNQVKAIGKVNLTTPCEHPTPAMMCIDPFEDVF